MKSITRNISTSTAFAASQYGEEKEYWLKKLSGELVKSSFPYDTNPFGRFDERKDHVKFGFSHHLSSTLMELSSGLDHRLYISLTAAAVSLIHKYSGNKDILVGVPIYRQERRGEFLNTILVLRTQLEERMSFKELILQVRQAMVEATRNQNYPIKTLMYQLDLLKSGTENEFPLFDISILLENIHEKAYLQTVNQNMIFSFKRTGEFIEGILEYNPMRYHKNTITRIIKHYTRLLENVLVNLDIEISRIEILTGEEKKQLLVDFNNTYTPYPKNKTIHELFEKQAERTPHHIAVIGTEHGVQCRARGVGTTAARSLMEFIASGPGKSNVHLTYNRLNRSSDQLGRWLKEKGVDTESIVGIMVERSLEMIIGILGILKAGGAYLPISPDYPEERINFMLKDSNAGVLATIPKLQVKVKAEEKLRQPRQLPLQFINIETVLARAYEHSHSTLASTSTCRVRPTNLAYIIYTSGTSGNPKGVMIEHRNVINVVTWFAKQYHLKTGINLLQMSDYTFDASVDQIFGSLLHGASLHVIGKELLVDMGALRKYIEKNQIHIINSVPLLLNELLSVGKKLGSLQAVISGADTLDDVTKDKILQKGYILYNQYGPTEVTIDTLMSKCTGDKASLGTPIANTKCYILDKYKNILPIGVIGELYVSGVGTARGYLNMPELTMEKFDHDLWDYRDYHDEEKKSTIKNNEKLLRRVPAAPQASSTGTCNLHLSPLAEKSPPGRQRQKMYRTGDLVRWLPDGRIEFFGRLDHQVKIRGYRIELGEIETRLLSHDEIKDAVVLAKEMGTENKALCAYIVSRDAAREFTVSELREFVSQKLPDYMRPTDFVQIGDIPRTIAGKVDLKSLPNPKKMINTGTTYEPPTNETQEKILHIWADVLGLDADKIGAADNFFELGGNSINILKIQSRLNKQFDHDLSMSTMFLYPTIRELAANIHEETLINKSKNIVKLNKGCKKKNIFIYHPLHGMIYQYMKLAELLKGHYNVYGIQSKGLTKDVPLPSSFDEMLKDYIPQIKAVQPKGPYLISGYCIGAHLAYETARILEDEGETVEKLIMLDARAFIPETMIRFLGIRKFLYEISTRITGQVRKDKKNTPVQPVSISTPANDPTSLKERIEANNKTIVLNYKYKRIIHSPVVVIRARENPRTEHNEKYWVKMTKGILTYLEIPGDHESILTPPHVKRLAEVIITAI